MWRKAKMYHFFRLRKTLAVPGVAAMCLCLAGCAVGAAGQPGEAGVSYEAVGGMEETPVIEYTAPVQLPNILIDRRGYSASDLKTAAVKAKELPETFSLVNAETGEEVYSGSIDRKSFSREQDCYMGYADFSQVKEPGRYYVKCGGLGKTYSFIVREQFYQELFEETYEQVMAHCADNRMSVSEAVKLLEAYECYKELFPDHNNNDIPDVLEQMQGLVTYMEENGVQEEQKALYAAFLTKFSYNYKDYHYQYASKCLQRAATVYGELPPGNERDADRFFALTELYRSTGLNTYRWAIPGYREYLEEHTEYLDEEGYYFGSMTYLMTRQRVDGTFCEFLMKHIMDRGEKISVGYWDLLHPLDANNDGEADLLKRAAELSCANFVLNNYQYTNILKDFLHYLMGKNPESVSFYEESAQQVDYLLLFAQMAWELNEAVE